jgi:hypothetical protein
VLHDAHEKGKRVNAIKKPTLNAKLDTLEEQLTIRGLKAPLSEFLSEDKTDYSELNDEEVAALFDVPDSAKLPGYEEINENNLRSAFGMDYRVDHTGTKKPSNLRIANGEATKEQAEYLSFLVSNGLIKELNEFVTLNPDIGTIKYQIKRKTLFEAEKVFTINLIDYALYFAGRSDEVVTFKKLIELGADPLSCPEMSNKWNICQWMAAQKAGKIFEYLLTLPSVLQNINMRDGKGKTLQA